MIYFRVYELIIQNWKRMIIMRMQWNVPVGSARDPPASSLVAKAPNGKIAQLNWSKRGLKEVKWNSELYPSLAAKTRIRNT